MDMFPKFILLLLSTAAGLANCESQEFNDKGKYLEAGNGTETDGGTYDSKTDFPDNDGEANGKAVECKKPNNPKNGVVFYEMLSSGSELRYECHEGYQLSPKQLRRKCRRNGKWSHSAPRCIENTEKRECGDPPKYDKTRIKDPSDESYPLGSTVTYLCDQGYITGGGSRKQSTCTEDPVTKQPVWTKVEILCSPKSCGHPGFVMNAQNIGSRFTFPNNVTFKCDAGYKMSGFHRRFCLASGTWSGTLPTCNKISCQRPRDPENGVAQYHSLEYDSELTYRCEKGFQLSSNVRRICGSDEKWTGDEPFCKEIVCELPEKPEYGSVEFFGGNVRVGSIAKFTCDEGRKLIGSETSRCLKSGDWSFETPQCIEPCIIPDIQNGQIGKYEITYDRWSRQKRNFQKVFARTTINEGEELMLKCNKRYKPKGKSRNSELKIICLNGELSPPPECITEPCVTPDIPNGQLGKYGRRTRSQKEEFLQVLPSSTIDEDDEVILKCDRNYKPRGRSGIQELKITCLSGNFSPTPECVIKPCIIPDISNGRLGTYEYVYGQYSRSEFIEVPAVTAIDEREELTLKCNKDFKLKGHSRRYEAKITCLNGKVSPPPECVTTRCYREFLNHTGLIEVDFVYLEDGKSFTPTCIAGYRVSQNHDRNIYCQKGKWTGNISPCTIARCSTEDLKQYPGIWLQDNGIFDHAQWIQPTCAEGFELKNKDNPKIYCNQGEWVGNLPPCFTTRCNTDDLKQYPGIQLQNHGIYDDAQWIQPTCAEGFELKNKDDPKIYCNQGKWEGNLPPCSSNSCLDDPPSILNGKANVASIQDGHTIWYNCDTNFKVTKKGNVTCVSGSWTGETPICGDTRCYKESLNHPGLINVVNSPVNDGWSFMPLCEPGFHVTANDDQKIYCRTGKWIGNIPPCTIDGCKTADLLKLNGLILNDNRAILNDDEKIWPTCTEGFILNKKNNDSWIYCRQGDWSGNLPPCSPAMCPNNPPVLDNGRMKSIHAGHGGTAEYECFEFYEMATQEKVVCSYGKWNGTPICKDTRCYLKDLPQKEGVDLTVDVLVHSMEKADISCIRGYRLSFSESFCERGEWRIPNKQKSPCEEDDCEIIPIENGEVFKETTKHLIKIFKIKFGEKTYLTKATIGSSESSGAVLYVKCKEGEKDEYLEITCRRGEWTPPSICGMRNNSVGTGSPEVSESTTKMFTTDGVTDSLVGDFSASTVSPENGSLHKRPPDRIELEVKSTNTISVCSCKYITIDNVLVAYDGNRKLEYNDEVKSGSTVVFHCSNPGLYRLRGEKTVTCPSECNWHSSWFPSCHPPGDKGIMITVRAQPQENLAISAGGVYTVISGTHLDMQCQIVDGIMTHLHWEIPQESGGYLREGGCVDQRKDCYDQASAGYCESLKGLMTLHCRRTCSACNSDYPFRWIYTIDEVSSLSSGEYTCTDRRMSSAYFYYHSVTIEVKDAQCPEITETENLIVTYEGNRNVNTRAHFRCRAPHTMLGPSHITCESTRQWSSAAASCSHSQCPEIAETEKLTVTYERNRDVNTKAYFHCLEPFIMYGQPHITCEQSGQWSGPAAECRYTQCPEIAESENLIVNYDSVRNLVTKAHFSCRKPYTKFGPDYITCEAYGKWSSLPATCRHIQCPEIIAEEPLIVTYSYKQNVNSTASFHCPVPYKRHGLPLAICQSTGEWSGTTPSCRMPTCSLSTVYDSLPAGIENVVPYTEGINEENVPHGFSINLHCDEAGFAFQGNSTAICNGNDSWTVDKNVKCVKGCARVQTKKDSTLQISSDKQTYEIGDSLTFSCPEGMKLFPDVQRIMCVSNGWTPNNIPDCQ